MVGPVRVILVVPLDRTSAAPRAGGLIRDLGDVPGRCLSALGAPLVGSHPPPVYINRRCYGSSHNNREFLRARRLRD